MSDIKYWVVKRESKKEEGVLKPVCHFTSDAAANEFAECDYFKTTYGGTGVVECIEFKIFETKDAGRDFIIQRFKDSAMAKLTPNEKKALGLTDGGLFGVVDPNA